MKIAVLSLTRDRLAYTKHCFHRLHNQDVCFDHYVFDQGSTDGTADWLMQDSTEPFRFIHTDANNIGISKAMNFLLDRLDDGYDAVVKFDNDCELTRFDTLRTACEATVYQMIVSPHIQGLKSPPPVESEDDGFGFVGQIGGIFMAVPGWVFKEFRYDDQGNPKWGMDDVQLSQWFRNHGGRLAYLMDHKANHYLTTVGQEKDQPEYMARKYAEMGL